MTSPEAYQLFKIWIFLYAYRRVIVKEEINISQYNPEQGVTPMTEGNFDEPLMNDNTIVMSMRIPKFLKINIFLPFLNG